MLQAFELGSEAKAFAQDQLKQGHELAAQLLREPLPEHWVALLPRGSDPSMLHEFEEGIGSRDESLEYLVTVIARYLRQQTPERPHAVFEDPVARKDYPFLERQPYKRLVVESFVYPYLGPGASSAEVGKTIRAIRWYPFVGVLLALKNGQPIGGSRDESRALLEKIARRGTALVIGAYDATGWLMGSRTEVDLQRLLALEPHLGETQGEG